MSYYNSRPSARGDATGYIGQGDKSISIHAPPRGATISIRCNPSFVCISIHAPPRGATTARQGADTTNFYFNSRPSARGDGKLLRHRAAQGISIHAPPRGATDAAARSPAPPEISIHAPPRGATIPTNCIISHWHFNSRPSARGDLRSWKPTRRSGRFQFTPLREGRPSQKSITPVGDYFNSRPSARGDGFGPFVLVGGLISIHAPPRGATSCSSTAFMPSLFQFTPLREGRLPRLPAPTTRNYFNSRPSARGDRQRLYHHAGAPISIHAPPRGATAKDMQFLQIFCSTLTNQHGLTIVPRNLSRLSW